MKRRVKTGVHPPRVRYDRAWPARRKAAYFGSLALICFWVVAILPYWLFTVLVGGMMGEAFIGRAVDFRVYFIMDVLPWIALLAFPLGATGLVWAILLWREGRYARSMAVYLMPLAPGAVVYICSFFAY